MSKYTNKSVRVLKHPSGMYEVQYRIKMWWGLLEFWQESKTTDDLEEATQHAMYLHDTREEKTTVVLEID